MTGVLHAARLAFSTVGRPPKEFESSCPRPAAVLDECRAGHEAGGAE